MKKLHLSMLALMLLICMTATGQTMSEEGDQSSLQSFFSKRSNFNNARFQSNYIVKVKFNNAPNKSDQRKISKAGVNLISKNDDGTYLVSIDSKSKLSKLEKINISTIEIPKVQNKIAKSVLLNELPEWADMGHGAVKVSVIFNKDVSPYEIQTILEEYDAETVAGENYSRFIQLTTILDSQIEGLAAHPLVRHIDYIQEPDQALIEDVRCLQKVNIFQNAGTNGLKLDGEGVSIGVGDGGELGSHLDFQNAAINKASGTYSSFGAHGDHVAGIIGSRGMVNPIQKGIAPASELIIQKTSLIHYYLEDYYNEFGMVLTNNSYGTSSNCETNGTYNYTSVSLDKQLNDFPDVLHVFAAGNSGGNTCTGYPTGYRTVLRYYQASKNVLTVGNLNENLVINPNSSRGPVLDGRLKPEILGIGTNVVSNNRDYGYYSGTGTSMAAPSVTGTLALMVQRYRQLNNDANPDGALLKAVACNTATDMGNKGPDYIHGFGLINAKEAIAAIEAVRYEENSVSQGTSQTHTITVPAGTDQVKAMLYWSDVEGSTTAATALVNDLNLSLNNGGSTIHPWVLDPTPANVALPAVRGIDNLNNIEQITLDNPTPGNLTFSVEGFDIPIGSQSYYFTYEFIKEELKLTFPEGGEILEPNGLVRVLWEAESSNTSEFRIDWSVDNGASWELVKNNIAASDRQYEWTAPANYTTHALVKVTRISDNETSSSNEFTVLGAVKGVTVSPGCANSLELIWEGNTNYVSYDLMQWTENGFEVVATTPVPAYALTTPFSPGVKYWFTVKGKTADGKYGRRSLAASGEITPGISCDWANDGIIYIPDFDIFREHTSDSLTTSEPVSLTVFNAGNNTLRTFTLKYQINSEPIVSETFNMNILSGEQVDVTFTQAADLSSEGEYNIRAWMEVDGDLHPENDALKVVPYRYHVPNNEVDLPFYDSFNASGKNYTGEYFAVKEAANVDIATGVQGEASFVNYDDKEVLYLKPLGFYKAGETFANSIHTYNLSNFSKAIHTVSLNVKYIVKQQIFAPGYPVPGNKIFVRGSDRDDWIEVFQFGAPGSWSETGDIDLSNYLTTANQDYSSSFQVKIEQNGLDIIAIDEIQFLELNSLPVELSEFTVAPFAASDALLTWTTEQEVANDFFEVQVSNNINGSVVEFRTLGFVSGKGNTNTLTNYQFVDREPLKTGTRYYRLKQVDFDGTTTYTDIRHLDFPDADIKITAFPNPTIDRLFIHTDSEQEQEVTIQLVDATGRLLRSSVHLLAVGSHNFEYDWDANLPAGFYSMKIIYPKGKFQSLRINKVLN